MTVFQTPFEQAQALVAKGDIDGAIPKLCEVLNSDFFSGEVLYYLGACMLAKGQHGLAAVVTSAAIDARQITNKPFPEAMLNLGTCYKREFRNEIAEKIWLRALKAETYPRERSKIWSNLAGLYVNEADPDKAISYANQALKEDPNNYGAHVNRGLAALERCDWIMGWHGLNHTYLSGDAVKRQYPGISEWDGSPGKKVIVYGDQGVGDEIYFSDCLRDLQKVCSKVIFDCHPRLPALFARSFPEITVHGTRKHLTEVDWLADSGAEASVCLSNLPSLYRNDAAGWTGEPWLFANQADKLKLILTKPRDVLRIGISWTGGTKKTHQHHRSLDIAQLEPILRARPDAQWFSLQYTPNAAREVCELEESTGIRVSHFPSWVECFDYDRTASFVASLDLVITVCTTVHHLGGALGIPTWTLVPKRANWRYCGGMTDGLPWYNSVRLFRQEIDGDWSAPIERVGRELVNL